MNISLLVSMLAAAESVLMDPVIVETTPEVDFSEPVSSTLRINLPTNNTRLSITPYGVEIHSMEGLQKLSPNRRKLNHWWIERPGRLNAWSHQFFAQIWNESQLRAQHLWLSPKEELTIDWGLNDSQKKLVFQSHGLSPYDLSTSEIETPFLQKSRFVELQWVRPKWEGYLSHDTQFQSQLLQSQLIGHKNISQTEFGGSLNQWGLQWSPYWQAYQQRFEDQFQPELSNLTDHHILGVQTVWPVTSKAKMQFHISTQELSRTFQDQASSEYSRLELRTVAHWQTKGWLNGELTLKGMAAFIEDEQSSGLLGTVDSQKKYADGLWDGGARWTIPVNPRWRLQTELRRFAHFPSPKQRFGDGAGLLEAPDLPKEIGWQWAAGPVLETPDIELSVTYFREIAENSPATMAVSPTRARTLPIGGSWVEGLKAETRYTPRQWNLGLSLLLQRPLNSSQISWQQGQILPGRPRWSLDSHIQYQGPHWKGGGNLYWRDREALDFSGLWSVRYEPQIDIFLGYRYQRNEWRFVVKNLFESYPTYDVSEAHRGSPQLIEPSLTQRDWHLQWEMVL